MLAKRLYIENYRELQRAEEMNLPVPEPKYVYRLISVDINEIAAAGLTLENNIYLLSRAGDEFVVKYNQIIWEAIVKKHNFLDNA